MTGYLTTSFSDNVYDLPAQLAATKLSRGDWLVIATVLVAPPATLSLRLLQLQLISAAVDPTVIAEPGPASRGTVYVALFKGYAPPANPASLTPQGSSDDVVVLSQVGLASRPISAELVLKPTEPAHYSLIVVNNTNNTDLEVAVEGQLRWKVEG